MEPKHEEKQGSPFSGWDNPIGTDGFEFLEFSSLNSTALEETFQKMGFVLAAQHQRKPIKLYQQGDIRIFINGETSGTSYEFAKSHGPCACAMGFRVKDAKKAYDLLLERGAKAFPTKKSTLNLSIPAIYGIGDSALYLVDGYQQERDYLSDFDIENKNAFQDAGLDYIDHVTHNVFQGNMDKWAGFYEKLFNFKEIRYFDIEGQQTGLLSRAMTSPCGKIRIPINESSDDKSQIVEYLKEYNGEGIQHIALGTKNIYQTVSQLMANQVGFLSVPDTYYSAINERLPEHREDLAALKQRKILIDGAPAKGQGLLLQIFTKNMIGPIFFEIIQRKGNEGFGEGNFQALFEAIERDQMERGVL